jgi:hypothetical protein
MPVPTKDESWANHKHLRAKRGRKRTAGESAHKPGPHPCPDPQAPPTDPRTAKTPTQATQNIKNALPAPEAFLQDLLNIWAEVNKLYQRQGLTIEPMPERLAGVCLFASEHIRNLLAKQKISTKIVGGYYGTEASHDEHAWLVTPDGTIIDPTESQFNSDIQLGCISVYPPGGPESALYHQRPYTFVDDYFNYDEISKFADID